MHCSCIGALITSPKTGGVKNGILELGFSSLMDIWWVKPDLFVEILKMKNMQWPKRKVSPSKH